MDESRYLKILMSKVVNIEDHNARTLITDLLSQDSKNREGMDLFTKSKQLSLEGHSLGQDVHFDKYNVIKEENKKIELSDTDKSDKYKEKISRINKDDGVSLSGNRMVRNKMKN